MFFSVELKAREGKSEAKAEDIDEDHSPADILEDEIPNEGEHDLLPPILTSPTLGEVDGPPLLKDLDELEAVVMNKSEEKVDLNLTDEDLAKILGFQIDEEEALEVRVYFVVM